MNTLERLQEWVEKEKGRQVDITKPNGYGPHDWEIRLVNVDVDPKDDWVEVEKSEMYSFATVVAIDNSRISNTYYIDAENFVLGVDEDLEATINLALNKAEELGL